MTFLFVVEKVERQRESIFNEQNKVKQPEKGL